MSSIIVWTDPEWQKNVDLSNLAVIAPSRLSEEFLIFTHLLLVRERDTVDSLQRIVVLVTQEVRGGVLNKGSIIKPIFRTFNVRLRTFVIISALILPVWGIWGPTQRSTIGPQRYTVVEVPSGILVSMMYFLYLLYYANDFRTTKSEDRHTNTYAEHLKKCFFRYDQALEFLFLFHNAISKLLKRGIVGSGNRSSVKCKWTSTIKANEGSPFFDGHFIEETIIRGRTNAEMASVMALRCLTQYVGGWVPENALSCARTWEKHWLERRNVDSTFRVFEIKELQRARAF